MDKPRKLTLGEARVGIDFNPGGNPEIADIKRKCADLIDAVAGIYDGRDYGGGETGRLKAIAMTEIEGAAHWAVKAAARSAAAKAGN